MAQTDEGLKNELILMDSTTGLIPDSLSTPITSGTSPLNNSETPYKREFNYIHPNSTG